jgi:hypothetical protein
MNIVARVDQMAGEQVCKCLTIADCVVITGLLVRQQRVCRLLRYLLIKVILPQIRDRFFQYALPLPRIRDLWFCESRQFVSWANHA